MKRFMTVLFSLLLLGSCADKKSGLPDLPYLTRDSVSTFKAGDRFIISTAQNSCCLYCWVKDSVVQEEITTSPLIKLIDVKIELADPGCAGCSDFRYYIFECVQPGQDSLLYATIPMGDLGPLPLQCDSLPREKLNSYRATYKFIIEE